VEAIFSGDDFSALNLRLDESGVEPCDGELLVRRSFSLGGSNRSSSTASPATLALLKSVGDDWSICTGRTIINRSFRRKGSSRCSTASRARKRFCRATRRSSAAQCWSRKRPRSAPPNRRGEQELDLLRHQLNEITAANLQPNEEEEIHARYRLASNSKRLIELATSIAQQLTEADNAILNQLARHSGCCARWKKSTSA